MERRMSKQASVARERIEVLGVDKADDENLVKLILGRSENLTRLMRLKLEAVLELGRRRAFNYSEVRGAEVHQPEDLEPVLLPLIGGLTREKFCVVLMDALNKVKGVRIVGNGTVDACILHPREVFREVLESEARSFVLAHNHPSGNPRPSAEDLTLTDRFLQASRFLGLTMMDHVIVAGREIISIRALGFWDQPDDEPGFIVGGGD